MRKTPTVTRDVSVSGVTIPTRRRLDVIRLCALKADYRRLYCRRDTPSSVLATLIQDIERVAGSLSGRAG